MGFKYAVIGSGRQGVAAAYDLVKFGDAEMVSLIDYDQNSAVNSARQVNQLTGTDVCKPHIADVKDEHKIKTLLRDVDAVISAVPYYYNIGLTRAAIETNTHFIDMGGNTKVVRRQLDMNDVAVKQKVAVVPDCGMGPGLNIHMIEYCISKMDQPEEAIAYEGGLPQKPKPPWNYELIFHINGLTNEYYGNAFAIQKGKVAEIPCFSDYEQLEFPEPFGTLEAAVTSGGLSTSPWTWEGKLKSLENKTLRYLGHWERFKAYSDLGLFNLEPVAVDGDEVVPRDFFHTLLEPKLKAKNTKDVGIMRIVCKGKHKKKKAVMQIDLIEYYDEETGFTAMQKLTGWHCSIMAILCAKGKIKPGSHSVESSVSGEVVLDEAKKRGFEFNESLTT